MKKMFLALLSLVVVSMFLVSCGPKEGETALAGEAFKAGNSKQAIPVKPISTDCSKLQNSCGFVSLKDLNNARIITLTQNPELKSCDNLCSINGGKTCIDAYIDIEYATGDAYGTVLHQWTPRRCSDLGADNAISCRCY